MAPYELVPSTFLSMLPYFANKLFYLLRRCSTQLVRKHNRYFRPPHFIKKMSAINHGLNALVLGSRLNKSDIAVFVLDHFSR
jgi:hypothetical protein